VVSQQEAHESVQILLFICLPPLVLLIAFISISVRASRTLAWFPVFSVRIWHMGYEGRACLHYREEKRLVEFHVAPSPRRGFFSAWLKNAKGEIVLIAPKNLTAEDVQGIIPNLCLGLARLSFQEYKVRREEDNQILAAGGTKQLRETN
jgi:hypothetical protein